MLGQDLQGTGRVGAADADLHIEPARAQDGGIDHVLPVRGPDDDDIAQGLHAVDLRQDLRDDRGLDVRGHPGAAGAEQSLHLVEEDDDGPVLGRDLAGLIEDGPDLPLGLADELAEQLGALDVQERRGGPAGPRTVARRRLTGQGCGHGLGDQRLAAAGRAVQEQSPGGPQVVGAVEARMGEGQLESVSDLVDLRAEAADVVPGDVGGLGDDELLDTGALDHGRGDPGAQVGDQGVAGPEGRGIQVTRQVDDASRARPGGDQDAGRAGGVQDLLQGDGLAGVGGGQGVDDEHLVADGHQLADGQVAGVEARVQAQAHGPPAEDDIDLGRSPWARDGLLATGIGGEWPVRDAREQGEGDRRQSDGVELRAQLGHALAGGGERLDEALVLRGQADGLSTG